MCSLRNVRKIRGTTPIRVRQHKVEANSNKSAIQQNSNVMKLPPRGMVVQVATACEL